MADVIVLGLGAFVVAVTLLALVRARVWWVRIWDFPRLQLALIGLVALAVGFWADTWRGGSGLAMAGVLAATTVYQSVLVWRWTRLAPHEVQTSSLDEPSRQVSLLMSNVLQTNRRADLLLEHIRAAEPDLVLCVETDPWWQSQLDALRDTHPVTVACPLDNTYGMLLYSRLEVEDAEVQFLVERDIPSIRAIVRLRDGSRVLLRALHPRPPTPQESEDSLGRDTELMVVGKQVRKERLPVIVCGDLNDVAWSRSTRLFQKVSRLVDPRKGRGLYSTFHARWPGFRYPLDHVFHSSDFRLVRLRRLAYVGSDHFPVHVVLSREPRASAEQEAPQEDADDLKEAAETIEEGREEMPRR